MAKAKGKNNIPGINLPWEYAIFIGVIVALVIGAQAGWLKWGGTHKLVSDNPVTLVDVDSRVSTVEKEETFLYEVKVSHGESVEILGFTINDIEYREFEKATDELGLYVIEVTATDLIGTQLYEVKKIHYQVNSEDKTLSVVETEGTTSSVNMTQTHNEPRFVGVSVNENVSVGTAVEITCEFDDVEGMTEVVINGVTYDVETDFDAVDNAESLIISLAGLSVGEYERVLESYTYDTGTTSVRVDLTANNTMTFSVVKAEPQLVSAVPSKATFTTTEIGSGVTEYDLVITMDEVDDLYSITIDTVKYILSTHSAVVDVNTVNDTITLRFNQTDDTVGTHTFEIEEYEYYDSLSMQEVILTESNTYSITVS